MRGGGGGIWSEVWSTGMYEFFLLPFGLGSAGMNLMLKSNPKDDFQTPRREL